MWFKGIKKNQKDIGSSEFLYIHQRGDKHTPFDTFVANIFVALDSADEDLYKSVKHKLNKTSVSKEGLLEKKPWYMSADFSKSEDREFEYCWFTLEESYIGFIITSSLFFNTFYDWANIFNWWLKITNSSKTIC